MSLSLPFTLVWLNLVVLFTIWRSKHPIPDEERTVVTVAGFACGLGGLVYGNSFLWAHALSSESTHMASHLVVLMVLAPLAAVALRAPLRSAEHRSTHLVLRNPFVWFAAFTVLIPVDHLTRLNLVVMQNQRVHVVETLVFFLVGIQFWSFIVGANTVEHLGHRILLLGLGIPVSGLSGLVMTATRSSSMGPVPDVHRAGWMMVLGGTALMTLEAIALGGWWLRGERSTPRGPRVPRPATDDRALREGRTSEEPDECSRIGGVGRSILEELPRPLRSAQP